MCIRDRDHVAFRSATGYYFDPGFIDYTTLVKEPGVSLPQPDGPDSISPEGYAANLTREKDLNYERTFTTRNQLLFQTTEDLKLILTYAYQQTKTGGGQSNSAGVLGTGRYENASRFTEPVNAMLICSAPKSTPMSRISSILLPRVPIPRSITTARVT